MTYINKVFSGPLVVTGANNLMISNCTFTDPSMVGKVAITLNKCVGVTISNCIFKNNNPVKICTKFLAYALGRYTQSTVPISS